ncbi:MAG: hypothetical protein H0U32_06305 [Thermoleophilaceae bacterium]|nr:hypothetical protein [Thermoleophilaceae bacterium]
MKSRGRTIALGLAVSRITRAFTPLAIVLTLSVTSTTTFSRLPSVSASAYTHLFPGFIGK